MRNKKTLRRLNSLKNMEMLMSIKQGINSKYRKTKKISILGLKLLQVSIIDRKDLKLGSLSQQKIKKQLKEEKKFLNNQRMIKPKNLREVKVNTETISKIVWNLIEKKAKYILVSRLKISKMILSMKMISTLGFKTLKIPETNLLSLMNTIKLQQIDYHNEVRLLFKVTRCTQGKSILQIHHLK